MMRYIGWAIWVLLAGVAQAEGQQQADNRWVTEVMAAPSNSSHTATLASGDTGNNDASLRDFFKKNVGHT